MHFVRYNTIKVNGRTRVLYKKMTSKSQNPVLYIKHNCDYITFNKYKLLSKQKMKGGTIISQTVIEQVLQVKDKLNEYYIDIICSREDQKKLIDTYNEIIWKGKKYSICYITAGALVWLLSGEDKVAPFSNKWVDAITVQDYEQYQNCAIAFVDDKVDDIESTLQHAFVSINNGAIILDSNWKTCEGLKQTEQNKNKLVNKLKKNKKYVMKCIPFDISPSFDERLNLIKNYNVKEANMDVDLQKDLSEEELHNLFKKNLHLLLPKI